MPSDHALQGLLFCEYLFLVKPFSMDSYMIFIEIVQHCLKIAYLEVGIFCETRHLIIQDIADFQLCKLPYQILKWKS